MNQTSHPPQEGHIWRAQFGHHHVSITADMDVTPTLYLKRAIIPAPKKRNREFLRHYRASRATTLDDIGKIIGHGREATWVRFTELGVKCVHRLRKEPNAS